MLTVLLVLQIIITVSMIVIILIQRTSSDGMAGLAGGGNSIMSGRASANLLTRITSILAAAFLANSLLMAAMTARNTSTKSSIIDTIKTDNKAPAVPLVGAPENTSPNNTKPVEQDSGKAGTNQNLETKPAVPVAE